MALANVHPLNEHIVVAYMADSGSASSVYLTSHWKGRVVKMYSVLGATTVATANNVFTMTVAGNAVTFDAAWQQLTSGSAAGDIATGICQGANANISEGDLIVVTSDGGGTNTTPTMIYAVIKGV